MRSGGAIPPPQKGYLSDTCAIPYENKENASDTPLCDTISKGYCAIWGGILHWAAKSRVRHSPPPSPSPPRSLWIGILWPSYRDDLGPSGPKWCEKSSKSWGQGLNPVQNVGNPLTLQSLLSWKSKGFSPKKQGFFSSRNP